MIAARRRRTEAVVLLLTLGRIDACEVLFFVGYTSLVGLRFSSGLGL